MLSTRADSASLSAFRKSNLVKWSCLAVQALCILLAIAMVHSKFGFFMNWTGTQKGEGFEYHLLVLAITAFLIIRGAGAFSIDRAIATASPSRVTRCTKVFDVQHPHKPRKSPTFGKNRLNGGGYFWLPGASE